MQFYGLLPAPNPLVQAADPDIKLKIGQIKKKDGYDESDSAFNMWDYFSDNKHNLIYQRFDNYPWSMIPLNNHRFAASCFFDCKKLLALNKEIRLTEFTSILNKNLYPSTMKKKEQKQMNLEQDSKKYNGLKFDSNFESGNLFTSYKVGLNEYDLMMQNDTNTKGNTQWFYFSVENTVKNSVVTFNIINFTKCDSLFNMGQRPVVFSIKCNKLKGTGWVKAGYNINYFRNKFKRENSSLKTYYTLSFSYKFEHSNDKIYFAQCYPYTHSQLYNFIERSIRPNKFAVVQELCKTISKLPCPLIIIGNGKKAIVFLARQHPGETPSSFTLEGTIEFLMSNCMEAEVLRNNFTFYIIPMINPDGVVFGNYRCNLYGTDLNRIWISPHKELHDSVWYVRELIKQINQSGELNLIIDFHGHSKKFNSFYYANSFCDEQKLLPFISCNLSKMINLRDCSFSIHESKKKTARVALQQEVKNYFTYTLEISFHAFRKLGPQDFTECSYKQLGEDVALSIFKLFENSMVKSSILPRALTQQQNDELDNLIKYCDLSQLQIGEDDSGSDSNPEEDVLQEQELFSFIDQKKQNKIVIQTKKKLNKIDKASQTDIQHYQNLMLEEKVLQRIEEQVKSIRKPNSDILGFQNIQEIITNYQDVPLQEGLTNSFQQTDISLQQILGKMQVYHVRVSNKNTMFQNQFTTQSNKPVVIILKNPYSKQQMQSKQETTPQHQELLSIKNRRRITSLTGRPSIDYKRLSRERQYSIQQSQQDRNQAISFTQQQVSPQNFLSQDATFEKIANISKTKFYDKQMLKNLF
ncbi:unnamed protein product [Paramecium pentaurelia]|uniref:Peptidase M14 domain-containing protein n=1 Tax=Paramecium pentaurelia TaxID=43138 RepID=A0A8S1TMM7_9CILI|nr:unnamed protein product [Paramecium pentaurelia]